MILTDLQYIDGEYEIQQGFINIDNGVIRSFKDTDDKDRISMQGLLALPGFIDIHTHGGSGADACDMKEEALETLSRHYARHGVTSFCPTTMTLPVAQLKKIFESIESFKGKEPAAYIQGINMEGPYVSKNKCGAQNPDYIALPDAEEFLGLTNVSKVSLVDVAPEADGAFEFAEKISPHCVCSIAHTDADYETAKKAIKHGFSHVTHFYNAMSGLSHRAPGVVGAVFEDDKVTAELICDGFHLSPAAVRIAFKVLGADRCVAISDSLSSADFPDGEYMLGGQKVIVKDGHAHLENGTIAGSTANLFEEFRNLLSFGIDFKTALKACSENPAKVIGVFDKCGSLEVGKNADIILVDNELNLKHVFVRGKMIF
ncbi:MAG: N-acetylglucosamine-6-phosphate deacetylase [Acutalibacteraceae bacterium]